MTNSLTLRIAYLLIFLGANSYAHTYHIASPFATDSTKLAAEMSVMGSSAERTPFWIQTNQFGVIPTTTPLAASGIKASHSRGLNQSGHLQLNGCIELTAYLSKNSRAMVPQANLGFEYKNWELFVGRKKQWVGIADSTLGTGSYAWSTNAMPILKIQLGTTKFVAVPFTNGWLWVNGFYSEGLFEQGRTTTGHLKLHQKALYARIGRPDSRVRLLAGFNHQVQWGGTSPYLTVDGRMPSGLRNYFRVITGKPGDASRHPNEFDNGNRVGNHLGSIDLGLEIESYGFTLFFYRQNIYEDGSLYAFVNIADGLNGARIRRKNSYGANFEVTECLLEFLYTKSQGGPGYDYDKQVIHRGSLGKDDYFNNAQIRDGWSYYGRTIGTPFITPTSETTWSKPRYADFFTSNNRVSVAHVGLKGTLIRKIYWTVKCSYSSNFGTYDQPFEKAVRQFSTFASLQSKINIYGPTGITARFGADFGDLFPKSLGYSLTVSRQFLL